MWPEQELNRQPFGSQTSTQSRKPPARPTTCYNWLEKALLSSIEILVPRANNRCRWSEKCGVLAHLTQKWQEARKCVIGPSSCSGWSKADPSHLWPRPNACSSSQTLGLPGASNFMTQTTVSGGDSLSPCTPHEHCFFPLDLPWRSETKDSIHCMSTGSQHCRSSCRAHWNPVTRTGIADPAEGAALHAL